VFKPPRDLRSSRDSSTRSDPSIARRYARTPRRRRCSRARPHRLARPPRCAGAREARRESRRGATARATGDRGRATGDRGREDEGIVARGAARRAIARANGRED
jgi:hypothetical protein